MLSAFFPYTIHNLASLYHVSIYFFHNYKYLQLFLIVKVLQTLNVGVALFYRLIICQMPQGNRCPHCPQEHHRSHFTWATQKRSEAVGESSLFACLPLPSLEDLLGVPYADQPSPYPILQVTLIKQASHMYLVLSSTEEGWIQIK